MLADHRQQVVLVHDQTSLSEPTAAGSDRPTAPRGGNGAAPWQPPPSTAPATGPEAKVDTSPAGGPGKDDTKKQDDDKPDDKGGRRSPPRRKHRPGLKAPPPMEATVKAAGGVS
jgi:hypothetical protein